MSTVLDAAYEALKKSGAPLYYREIIEQAIQCGALKLANHMWAKEDAAMELAVAMHNLKLGLVGDPRFLCQEGNVLSLAFNHEAFQKKREEKRKPWSRATVLDINYMASRLAAMSRHDFKDHACSALRTMGVSHLHITDELDFPVLDEHILMMKGAVESSSSYQVPITIALFTTGKKAQFVDDAVAVSIGFPAGEAGIIVANREFTQTAQRDAGRIKLIGVRQAAEILCETKARA